MRQRAAGVMGVALAFTNFITEHRLTSGNVRSVVQCVLTLIVSADSEIRWPVQAFIFSLIAYFMIHFEFDAGQFFFFWLVMCLSCLTLAYLGMVVVCITPNLEMGITLGATMLGMWFAFAGFLIPRPLMPEVRNAVAVSAVQVTLAKQSLCSMWAGWRSRSTLVVPVFVLLPGSIEPCRKLLANSISLVCSGGAGSTTLSL
jgi:ABC-2 type transporter